MNYYSTNGKAPIADLQKAVVKGLAEDRGLYMPEEIKILAFWHCFKLLLLFIHCYTGFFSVVLLY